MLAGRAVLPTFCKGQRRVLLCIGWEKSQLFIGLRLVLSFSYVLASPIAAGSGTVSDKNATYGKADGLRRYVGATR